MVAHSGLRVLRLLGDNVLSVHYCCDANVARRIVFRKKNVVIVVMLGNSLRAPIDSRDAL